MRINLYLLLCILVFSGANAQKTVRQKADAYVPTVVRLFNHNSYDSLYRLGGKYFQQSWPTAQRFRDIMHGLHTGFGEIAAYKYEKIIDSTVYYQADFKKETMGLGLTINSAGQLVDFSIISNVEAPEVERVVATTVRNPLATELDKKTDTLAQAFMERNNTASLAIGVLENGQFHTYGYGETKRGNGSAPTQFTLYEIGSISKTFTGILLAYFVEQKKIRLDDPINKYLPDSIPELSFNGKKVTVASLSNHSSGLPRLPSNLFDEADMQNPYKHYDDQRLFRFLKNYKLTREPGEQYEYSNLAVGLLGVILERISGKTYEELLKEIIRDPLAMGSTRIKLTDSDITMFAQGYRGEAPVHSWEFVSLVGAGGIRSCVYDMLLYAKAQVDGGNSALDKAIGLSHQVTWEKGSTRVGLGWHLVTRNGISYLFHNGQTGGYYTVLLINPKTKRAVVMLTNALVDPMITAVELITWLDK
jgi:CubicO group peptidase (beta-lactamase class C family)